MADLNLSLEIAGTTTRAVDELTRLKVAGEQVGQTFTKQAQQMEAAGQAGTQAVAQLTDRARAANEVLKQLVDRGRSFPDAFKSAQSFGGVAPTLSAADLGLQAQAAHASRMAASAAVASNPADLYRQRSPSPEEQLWALRQPIVPPSQTGTGDGRSGFQFPGGEGGILRTAAAVLGVGVGLNAAAQFARKLHDEIAAGIEAERGLEIGARSVAAAYGQSVLTAFQAASKAFVLDPSTRGTEAQFLQGAAGMRELTTAYGLNDQQVQQLMHDAGELARIHGVDLPTAGKALEAVMMGNTSAAASLGVTLTDEQGRLRGAGASYEELVAISGRARAEAILFAKAHEAVATEQRNAAKTSDDLATAFDRLARAAENSKAALGGAAKGPVAGGSNALADLLSGDPAAMARIVGDVTGNPALLLLADQMQKARKLVADKEKANMPAGFANEQLAGQIYTDSAGAVPVTAYQKWRIEIDRTTEALGKLQAVQSQFATIAKATEGNDFPFRLAPGQANTIGAARAASDFLNEQAQVIAADRARAMRDRLQANATAAQASGDPGAILRTQIDLQYLDQRAAAQSKLVEAQHQQVNAELDLSVARRQDLDNVQALANAQAEIVGHAQEQRDIAHELNSIDDQRVQVARELAVLNARQAELPAGRRVQDLQREQALLLAQAHLHPDQRADVAGRLRDITLHGMPEAQYADLQAQGTVIAAQRAQEDSDIARQIRLSPTRLQQINLDAILRPVQDMAAKLAEEQQLKLLGATPEEIAVIRAQRAAEDAQRALYGIQSPGATAGVAGVGATAQSQTFQVTVYANGTAQGDVGQFGSAAQAGGLAFLSAFNEALATTALPPVRPMFGGADGMLEP